MKYKHFALAAIGAACLSLPATLYGQFDLPDPEHDHIVVIGRPFTDDLLRQFVTEVGRETDEDQFGRWYDDLCPAVVGLQPDIGNYVLGTIRSVAEIADAPLEDDEDCRANVIVLFTTDPDQAISQLQASRPELFGNVSPAAIRQIAESGNTVSVVSRINVRGSAGQLGQTTTSASFRGTSPHDKIVNRPEDSEVHRVANNLPGEGAAGGAVQENVEASRIARATRPEFDFRMVVIDLNDIAGQTIRQLSAYTAMIVLGDFNLEEPIESQQSILNALHDPLEAPADITDWDLAYLRALYRLRPGRNATAQRRQLFSASRRVLDRGELQAETQ